MTRIFLAGASGAIGRPLTAMLVAAGHEVTGTSRTEAGAATIVAAGATAAMVDVRDAAAVAEAMIRARPDVVIYQVTDLSLKPGEELTDERLEANADVRQVGTRNVVEATAAAGARRLIAQSIAWLYLPGPEPHTEDESIVPAAAGRGPAHAPGRHRPRADDDDRSALRWRRPPLRPAVRSGDLGDGPRRAADGPCRGRGRRRSACGGSWRARDLPDRQRWRPGLERKARRLLGWSPV